MSSRPTEEVGTGAVPCAWLFDAGQGKLAEMLVSCLLPWSKVPAVMALEKKNRQSKDHRLECRRNLISAAHSV
jgi:hypothetical protein